MRTDADYQVLKQYGCTYLGPDYDPRTHLGATPYCGCKTLVADTLYCPEHHEIMYVKGSALRRRHKDIKRAEALRQLISDFNLVVEDLESEGFEVYEPTPLESEL